MQTLQALQNFAAQQTAKRPMSYTQKLMKRVRYDDSKASKRKCAETLRAYKPKPGYSVITPTGEVAYKRARNWKRAIGYRYNHQTGSWG